MRSVFSSKGTWALDLGICLIFHKTRNYGSCLTLSLVTNFEGNLLSWRESNIKLFRMVHTLYHIEISILVSDIICLLEGRPSLIFMNFLSFFNSIVTPLRTMRKRPSNSRLRTWRKSKWSWETTQRGTARRPWSQCLIWPNANMVRKSLFFRNKSFPSTISSFFYYR